MKILPVVLMVCLVGAIVIGGAPVWWTAPAPMFVAGLWMTRRDRCAHLCPALLPAVRQADGSTQPPRWFCSDCGVSWT
jgi:hypothetical protein